MHQCSVDWWLFRRLVNHSCAVEISRFMMHHNADVEDCMDAETDNRESAAYVGCC